RRHRPDAAPRPPVSLDDVPNPQPAAPGSIRIDEYPQRNDNQPSPLALVWPANRAFDANEELLAQLFFANVAGDATTNLYKLFIDGRTRKLDIGARGVSAN